MKLEKVVSLTPKILKKYVFEQRDNLKLLRAKLSTDILVASDDFQHAWMGVPGDQVASAASISQTGYDNPALVYSLGGSSLNDEVTGFIFCEEQAERLITFNLLESMLVVLHKSGVEFFEY